MGWKEYSDWIHYIGMVYGIKGGWWMEYSGKIQWNLWKTLGGMGLTVGLGGLHWDVIGCEKGKK